MPRAVATAPPRPLASELQMLLLSLGKRLSVIIAAAFALAGNVAQHLAMGLGNQYSRALSPALLPDRNVILGKITQSKCFQLTASL